MTSIYYNFEFKKIKRLYIKYKSLELFIIVIWKGLLFGLLELILELLNLGLIHLNLSGKESRSLDQIEVRVTSQASEKPEERFFILIIALGTYVIVL